MKIVIGTGACRKSICNPKVSIAKHQPMHSRVFCEILPSLYPKRRPMKERCVLLSGILHRTSGKSMIVRSQCNSCYGLRFWTGLDCTGDSFHHGNSVPSIAHLLATPTWMELPFRICKSRLFYGSVQNQQCNNRREAYVERSTRGVLALTQSCQSTKNPKIEATSRVCSDSSGPLLSGLCLFEITRTLEPSTALLSVRVHCVAINPRHAT
jgi:hypothetical protein